MMQRTASLQYPPKSSFFGLLIFGQALLLSVVAPVVSAFYIWAVQFDELLHFDLSALILVFSYSLWTLTTVPAWVYVLYYATDVLLIYGVEQLRFLKTDNVLKWVLLVSVSAFLFYVMILWLV